MPRPAQASDISVEEPTLLPARINQLCAGTDEAGHGNPALRFVELSRMAIDRRALLR